MQQGPGEETPDERVGRNVRQLRERAGMSKGALLRAMKDAGHSWYPATVTRIEAGRQSARSAELEDLKTILKTSLDRLFWRAPEAEATEFLYAAGASVRRAYETVAEAVRDHLHTIRHAGHWAAHWENDPHERVQEARADTLSRIEHYGPEDAFDEGVRRWDERADEIREGTG